MGKILISGGTGMVGDALSRLLRKKGHRVAILSRAKPQVPDHYHWNIQDDYVDPMAIDNGDVIVHLAGAGVADKKWSEERKLEIMSSRTQSTKCLINAYKKAGKRPAYVLSASAIGYYGWQAGARIDEQHGPGDDFLAQVCQAWELSADGFRDMGVPVGHPRIGVVLSASGGALEKMAMTAPIGITSYFGHGQNQQSWIHLHDLCRMLDYAIEHRIEGPFNAVAPNSVSAKSLSAAIGKAHPFHLFNVPAPAFVAKAIFGEMSQIILSDQDVLPKMMSELGFQFHYPYIDEALNAIYRR